MELTEKAKYKQKFNQTYLEKIKPKLQNLEEYRQSLLKMKYETYFNILLKQLNINKISKMSIDALLICPTKIQNEKNFKKLLKDTCFKDLVDSFGFIAFGADLGYCYKNTSLSKHDIPNKFDDQFHGCYKDVKFSIIEGYDERCVDGKIEKVNNRIILFIEFNKLTKSKINIQLNTTWIRNLLFEILCGILLIGPSNAYIILFILSSIEHNTANWIKFFAFLLVAIFLDYCAISSLIDIKLFKINLEDRIFNKKFRVEAEDQIEARYILTPSFMERLNNLKSIYGSKNIRVNFNKDLVSIVIETKKDLFEIGDLYTRATDTKQVDRFFEEVIAITDIIDHFKLNEKTGL